jgi:hypothetical protein
VFNTRSLAHFGMDLSGHLLVEPQDPEWGNQHIISSKEHDRLVLQVRAFLEASEEVDIDAETLADLIQALNQDDHSTDVDGFDRCHNGQKHSDAIDEEIDVSALYNIEDEGNGSKHI